MHIFRNEFEVYKERLLRDLNKTYKYITFVVIASDINDYIDGIYFTIRIDKLGLQKSLHYKTEIFNSMGDMDNYIKTSAEESIKIMLRNYFKS